jgi:hypothetical protein
MTLMACTIVAFNYGAENGPELPEFGLDTVLVWNTQSGDSTGSFVARIAGFRPNLLLEWEEGISQGTVLMPSRDVSEARGYVNRKLFLQGMDTRSDNETTLWLSRKIFLALKEDGEAKCYIDRSPGKMTYEGEEELVVEINGTPLALPVIRVKDDRRAVRWFLNREDNPLLIRYELRQFSQALKSITTNRRDTLRWLKGRKLERLLHQ